MLFRFIALNEPSSIQNAGHTFVGLEYRRKKKHRKRNGKEGMRVRMVPVREPIGSREECEEDVKAVEIRLGPVHTKKPKGTCHKKSQEHNDDGPEISTVAIYK